MQFPCFKIQISINIYMCALLSSIFIHTLSRINMIFFVTILLFITVSNLVFSKIPEYIKVCKENDPNITQCIYNSVLNLKPKLKAGIPELDVPSFEPMYVDNMYLKSGPESARIESNLTEMETYGMSNFEVEQLKVNIKQLEFFFKVRIPVLQFVGNYKLNMQFLFLNIRGDGPMVGNFSDFHLAILLKGNKVLKEGIEYIHFDRAKVKMDIGKMYIYLKNLFNGNESLAATANIVINENSDLILMRIKPNLDNAVAAQITEVANKVVLNFSYKELFA